MCKGANLENLPTLMPPCPVPSAHPPPTDPPTVLLPSPARPPPPTPTHPPTQSPPHPLPATCPCHPGAVQLWNVSQAQPLRSFKTGLGAVQAVALIPGTHKLLLSAVDGTVGDGPVSLILSMGSVSLILSMGSVRPTIYLLHL